MFFLHNLSRTITLHPSFFGPKVNDYLTSKLYEDVEGTCVGSYYIICIVDIINISEGKIIPGTGKAEYTVWYRAVLWRPFRGEVLDAYVDGQVNRMGFFCSAGPGKIFVSSWQMPSELKFRPDSNPPSYSDDENDQTIQHGSHVRIKLIGARFEGGQIFGVGTMKEDYLGKRELDGENLPHRGRLHEHLKTARLRMRVVLPWMRKTNVNKQNPPAKQMHHHAHIGKDVHSKCSNPLTIANGTDASSRP